jgi:hypothetical protein
MLPKQQESFLLYFQYLAPKYPEINILHSKSQANPFALNILRKKRTGGYCRIGTPASSPAILAFHSSGPVR